MLEVAVAAVDSRDPAAMLYAVQDDVALEFGADQYSFFGGLGPGSTLEGALEVSTSTPACCPAGTALTDIGCICNAQHLETVLHFGAAFAARHSSCVWLCRMGWTHRLKRNRRGMQTWCWTTKRISHLPPCSTLCGWRRQMRPLKLLSQEIFKQPWLIWILLFHMEALDR